MKKVLLIVLATALAATSCLKESVVSGNSTVFINVKLPTAVTKAAGEGLKVDKLFYEVYCEDELVAKNETSLNNGAATLNISLMRGVNYDLLLWAQSSETKIYSTQSLKNIEIKYSNNPQQPQLGNDETRDAFCAYEPIYFSDQQTVVKTVFLKRPLSQLNFVTYDYGQEGRVGDTYLGTLAVRSSNVQVKEPANKYNVLTGEATANTNATAFFYAEGPVDVDNTYGCDLIDLGKDQPCYHVSMNYILVPSNKVELEVAAQFKVAYYDAQNKTYNHEREHYFERDQAPTTGDDHFEFVPVAKNHRTNIVGYLFSGNGEFTVDLDNSFEGNKEDNYHNLND